MRTRITIGIVAVVALGLLVACGDDDTTPTPTRPSTVQPVTPTQPVVTAQNLTIQGPTWFADSNELEVDQTAQLRANLELSDGSTREDVDAEWTSSNTTVATVSADGLLTGRQPGGFDLRATAEGLTARVSGIRVVPKPVPWRASGTGATILDLPTRITRIRIEGEYTGSSENFVIWCGSAGDRGGALGQRNPRDPALYPLLGHPFGATQLQERWRSVSRVTDRALAGDPLDDHRNVPTERALASRKYRQRVR